MSADAWRVCPLCGVTREAKIAAEEKKVADLYGKVDADKYIKAVHALDDMRDTTEDDCTLREGCYIAMQSSGELVINYSCSCDVCGFRFSHENTIQAPLESSTGLRKKGQKTAS